MAQSTDRHSSNLSPRARISGIARQAESESARRDGNDNDLWISADSMRSSVNIRFTNFKAPMENFEWDMHDLWHTYYVASKHTSAHDPGQDRLVLQVVSLKELGVLTRPGPTDESVAEEAITSDGKIWVDLPFLVGDMTKYWVTGFPGMSAAQRINFAMFLAKLASLDLVNDKLCGIGLVTLRDALETSRPLGKLGDQDDEDTQRRSQDISVAALLPSANTWLCAAGTKLIQLSEQNWNNCAPGIGAVGELVENNLLGEIPAKGFSPKRWLYWMKRLEEVADAASSNSPDLSEYARRMVGNMLVMVSETNSPMKRAVEVVQRTARDHRLAPLLDH